MIFLKRRKLRKQLKTVVHHATVLRLSREDLMNEGQLAFLDEHIARAKDARAVGDIAAMESAGEALDACMTKLNPPKPLAWWRENFDVLVVAIGVAMAFRAYFYQPFKIPTGSMQPTLYGIHSEAQPVAKATILDDQPLKFFKWLVTGESFHIIRAQVRGTVGFSHSDQSAKPGYTPIIVGGYAHYVPNDVIEISPYGQPLGVKGGVRVGQQVRAGEVLWSGVVTSGDFLFVNRWKWNFCHPQRGEVMVFATTGIRGLQQGTHYIKRMTGLPNETLQINAPNLLVNGKPVLEPLRIGQIARKERIGDWAPAYSGFNPGGSRAGSLATELDTVKLGPLQYYAMGDNSFNSYDSRYWGAVPERNLLGPAAIVYWPFTSPRLGVIR